MHLQPKSLLCNCDRVRPYMRSLQAAIANPREGHRSIAEKLQDLLSSCEKHTLKLSTAYPSTVPDLGVGLLCNGWHRKSAMKDHGNPHKVEQSRDERSFDPGVRR